MLSQMLIFMKSPTKSFQSPLGVLKKDNTMKLVAEYKKSCYMNS